MWLFTFKNLTLNNKTKAHKQINKAHKKGKGFYKAHKQIT